MNIKKNFPKLTLTKLSITLLFSLCVLNSNPVFAAENSTNNSQESTPPATNTMMNPYLNYLYDLYAKEWQYLTRFYDYRSWFGGNNQTSMSSMQNRSGLYGMYEGYQDLMNYLLNMLSGDLSIQNLIDSIQQSLGYTYYGNLWQMFYPSKPNAPKTKSKDEVTENARYLLQENLKNISRADKLVLLRILQQNKCTAAKDERAALLCMKEMVDALLIINQQKLMAAKLNNI